MPSMYVVSPMQVNVLFEKRGNDRRPTGARVLQPNLHAPLPVDPIPFSITDHGARAIDAKQTTANQTAYNTFSLYWTLREV